MSDALKLLKALCFFFGVLFAYGFFIGALQQFRLAKLNPTRVTHYMEWVKPENWKPHSCRVLQSGLSNRGACPSGDDSGVGVPGNYLKYTECPGWDFCAQEDQPCECTGEVMLSKGMYGLQYVPDMIQGHHEIIKNVTGTTQCSLSVFDRDPMPGFPKACWCLRQLVANVVRAKGPLDAAQCLNIANTAFEAAGTNADTAAQSLVEEQSNDGERGAENNVAGLKSGLSLLGLPDGFYIPPNTRGGGCEPQDFVYLPWAMVEVIDDQDPTVKSLRCAYTYGADAASRVDNAPEAWTIYQRYEGAIGSEISCELRDDCTVATEPLQNLLSDEQRSNDSSWWLVKVLSVIAACIMVGLSCCWKAGFPDLEMTKGQVYGKACGVWLFICSFYGIPALMGLDGAKGAFQADLQTLGVGVIGGLVLFLGIPMCASPFPLSEIYAREQPSEPTSEPLL